MALTDLSHDIDMAHAEEILISRPDGSVQKERKSHPIRAFLEKFEEPSLPRIIYGSKIAFLLRRALIILVENRDMADSERQQLERQISKSDPE